MSISSKSLNWRRTTGIAATALFLGGTLATTPIIAASPDSSFGLIHPAYAAEVPLTITSIEVNENGLTNDNGMLDSPESVALTIAFDVEGDVTPGSSSLLTLSEGFKPLDGSVVEVRHPDGTLLGTMARSSTDGWTITWSDNVARYDANTLKATVVTAVGADIGDDPTLLNSDPVRLMVNGVDTGKSYVIPGRAEVTGSYTPIYPFYEKNRESLGPAFVLWNGDHDGSATITLTPEVTKWLFNTDELTAENILAAIRQDPDGVNVNGAWDEAFSGTATVTEFTKEKLVIQLDNMKPDVDIRLQLRNTAGLPIVLDDKNYGVTGTVVSTLSAGTNVNKSIPGWTRLINADAYGDADTAAPQAQDDVLKLDFDTNGEVSLISNDSALGKDNKILPETATFEDGLTTKTVDGVTFTIDRGVLKVISAGSNNAGSYNLAYQVADIHGKVANATATVEIAQPTINVNFKAYIGDQDANEAIKLAPGDQVVRYEIINPNSYHMTADMVKSMINLESSDGANTSSVQVQIPADFTVAPGETASFTVTGHLPKQGELVSIGGVSATKSFTLNGKATEISANAEDPAMAVALNYHADFQSYVGEGENLVDADTADEAYTPEVITDKDVTKKELDIRLDASNTGEGVWNVEKVTYVIKDAEGNTVQIDQGGTMVDEGTVELGETTIVEPGQVFSISGKQVFGIGKYSVEYTLHTDQGQVLMDPIFVEVVQEIVPNDAPTVDLPKADIPVVEEEKPADPVVVTKTEEKPKSVDPNTGEGASAKIVANTDDTSTEESDHNMALIIGGAVGVLLIGGIVVGLWRKGALAKLAQGTPRRKK